MLRELWQRFASAYGTPNFFDGSARGSGAVAQAGWAMQGVREIPAYQWEQTRYVLSLGAGILEASCQAIYFARATAWLKRGGTVERGKIVQVEPSCSRTAACADEWISIAPGTHGAFALALAHVLVRDGTYDKAFVDAHCFGFEAWKDAAGAPRRGFRSVLADYAPESVAPICGVDVATLERIARELAQTRPAFVITDARATQASNGLQTAMAVNALNALLGSLERPGGVLVQREAPLAPWPPLAPDAVAEAGLRAPRLDGVGAGRYPLATSVGEALADALASGQPYPLDTLLLYYANPAYAWLNPERWRKALAAAPFIASFTPFLDETSAGFADLILPDHSYLERFEDAAPAPATGAAIFGIRQPVVEPLHATRSTGDVVIELAQALEGSVGEAFPWKDFRLAVLRRARRAARGQAGLDRGRGCEEVRRGVAAGRSLDGRERALRELARGLRHALGPLRVLLAADVERARRRRPGRRARASRSCSRTGGTSAIPSSPACRTMPSCGSRAAPRATRSCSSPSSPEPTRRAAARICRCSRS